MNVFTFTMSTRSRANFPTWILPRLASQGYRNQCGKEIGINQFFSSHSILLSWTFTSGSDSYKIVNVRGTRHRASPGLPQGSRENHLIG